MNNYEQLRPMIKVKNERQVRDILNTIFLYKKYSTIEYQTKKIINDFFFLFTKLIIPTISFSS